jgi:hypothetical protein
MHGVLIHDYLHASVSFWGYVSPYGKLGLTNVSFNMTFNVSITYWVISTIHNTLQDFKQGIKQFINC